VEYQFSGAIAGHTGLSAFAVYIPGPAWLSSWSRPFDVHDIMTRSKIIVMIVGSALLALAIEALCVLMMMSGGVFFGPVAYVGIALLWPSLYICNLICGDGGIFISPILVFFQFFIPILWLVAKTHGRNAA
jgi:hypothetical protein